MAQARVRIAPVPWIAILIATALSGCEAGRDQPGADPSAESSPLSGSPDQPGAVPSLRLTDLLTRAPLFILEQPLSGAPCRIELDRDDDPSRNLVGDILIDDTGRVQRVRYHPADRPDPVYHWHLFEYDDSGHLLAFAPGQLQYTSLVYDDDGRLVERRYHNAGCRFVERYDETRENELTVSIDDGCDGTVDEHFIATLGEGRLTVASSAAEITYLTGPNGRLSEVRYDGLVPNHIERDEQGRIVEVRPPLSPMFPIADVLRVTYDCEDEAVDGAGN